MVQHQCCKPYLVWKWMLTWFGSILPSFFQGRIWKAMFPHHNPLNTCFYNGKHSPAWSVPTSRTPFPKHIPYFSTGLTALLFRTFCPITWDAIHPLGYIHFLSEGLDRLARKLWMETEALWCCSHMCTHHFQSCTASLEKHWIDHQLLHLLLLQGYTNTLAVSHSPGFSVIWTCGLIPRLKTKNNFLKRQRKKRKKKSNKCKNIQNIQTNQYF